MFKNYTFLAMVLHENQEISSKDLEILLEENLSAKEQQTVFLLREETALESKCHSEEELRQHLHKLMQKSSGFLSRYAALEWEIRTALVDYRSQPEKGIKLEGLKAILEKHSEEPMLLYKALLDYKCDKLQSTATAPFSLDTILWEVWRLDQLQKWLRLDRAKGIMHLDHLLERTAC